ncbi:MAG: DUF389 domain-containing protein [Planctomycetota bacterium]
MSVAIFVTSESEAACLIPWGVRFARAQHSELLVVSPRKSKGKESFDELGVPDEESTALHQAVAAQLENIQSVCDDIVLKHLVNSNEAISNDHDRIIVSLMEVVAPEPESAFVAHVQDLDVRLLLIPTFKPIKNSQKSLEWEERIFLSAPCGVVAVRGTISPEDTPLTLMFASEDDEDADDVYALKQTALLGRSTKGTVSLLFVRPSDDEVAHQVAEKHVDRLEKQIRHRQLDVEKRIELAESFVDGVNQVDLNPFDLVVVGTRSNKNIRQLFNQLKSDQDDKSVPLAIMRQAVPMTDQLWSKFKQFVRSKVPQISRELRVNLVDRLTSNSNFDFDFCALISLSTLIAALGLIQNSAAVVIGAMLVAPLMTPLVAIGLALVQGNERLLKSALVAVFYGFSVALLIGVIVGGFVNLTMHDYTLGSELRSRGVPNLLDLIVALASGVAAAYAMGRPHLISALPGVAIAAALVPPIATSGVAIALGQFAIGGGALLLFFTNIVAIVLGTTITFWSVGISTHVAKSDSGREPRIWPRYWFIGFVILSFLIAAEFVLNPFSANPPQNEPKKTTTSQTASDGQQSKQ